MVRSKCVKKLSIRRFLRPKSAHYGNDSTINVSLDLNKTPKIANGSGEIKARGEIVAYFSMRDCSESVSIDFCASKQHRHMVGQHETIKGIIRDLQKLDDAYESAICELRDEGYFDG